MPSVKLLFFSSMDDLGEPLSNQPLINLYVIQGRVTEGGQGKGTGLNVSRASGSAIIELDYTKM